MQTDTYCGNCGEPIYNEDSSNRTPCPNCGSMKRKYSLKVSATVSVSISVDATTITYAQSFLDTAGDWIDGTVNELYSMAIIVCHAACEIATERAFDRAFGGLSNDSLETILRKRIERKNIDNEEVRKLFDALTGGDLASEPFWPRYMDSVERRNAVAHRAKLFTQDEARETHKAATALVNHLEEA